MKGSIVTKELISKCTSSVIPANPSYVRQYLRRMTEGIKKMTGFRVKHGMTKEVCKYVFTYGVLKILCVMGLM
jgi:hypothetical protein